MLIVLSFDYFTFGLVLSFSVDHVKNLKNMVSLYLCIALLYLTGISHSGITLTMQSLEVCQKSKLSVALFNESFLLHVYLLMANFN